MSQPKHNVVNDSDYDGDTSTASEYDTESEVEDNLIEFKEYILLQALSFKTALCLEFMEKLKSLNGERIEEKNKIKNDFINRVSIYKRILNGIYYNNQNFKPDMKLVRLSYCKNFFGDYDMPSKGFPDLGYSCRCNTCLI